MEDNRFGFREIEHTADWALQVWAPDLPGLFATAAQGMYALLEADLQPGDRAPVDLRVEGGDPESLLVAFLSELLYLTESRGLGFDRFEVIVEDLALRARVWGAPLREQRKEIKAVTYYQLRVQCAPAQCTVTIVFDV